MKVPSGAESTRHDLDNIEKASKHSIAHEPSVIVATVILDPHGIRTVFTAVHIKKRGLNRKNTEIWTPRNNADIDEICHTVLLKAAAYLPNKGTVYYTLPGLKTVNVLARGEIEFISIDKKENPEYAEADNLATQHWMQMYQ